MVTYEEYSSIRNSKGLKDSDVAKAACIPASTFSDWKKGKSRPKEPKLMKIADALGVTYAYLMGWESEVEPSTKSLEDIIRVNAENGGQSKFAEFLYDTTVKKAIELNITEEELKVIQMLRDANESSRDLIIRMLAFAVEQDK